MNNEFKTIKETMSEIKNLEETNYYFEQIFKLKRLSFELFRTLRTSEIMINSETIIKYKDNYITIITENIIYEFDAYTSESYKNNEHEDIDINIINEYIDAINIYIIKNNIQ